MEYFNKQQNTQFPIQVQVYFNHILSHNNSRGVPGNSWFFTTSGCVMFNDSWRKVLKMITTFVVSVTNHNSNSNKLKYFLHCQNTPYKLNVNTSKHSTELVYYISLVQWPYVQTTTCQIRCCIAVNNHHNHCLWWHKPELT